MSNTHSCIPTATLGTCNAVHLMRGIVRDGAFLLQKALPVKMARKAHADAREAFAQEAGYIRRQPFHAITRTGYTPAGIEGTGRTGPNSSRHFFDYRPGEVSLHPSKDVLEPLHQRLVAVAGRLFTLIDDATGLDLSSVFSKRPILRIAECLNDAIDQSLELFPAHIDFGLLTFFLGGASAGLQIQKEGEWVPLEPSEGDIVVGTGSILKQYYGRSVSMRHRIMASSARRVSFFMFLDPAPETLLPSGELASEFFARLMAAVRYAP